jgi:hypothetical protein
MNLDLGSGRVAHANHGTRANAGEALYFVLCKKSKIVVYAQTQLNNFVNQTPNLVPHGHIKENVKGINCLKNINYIPFKRHSSRVLQKRVHLATRSLPFSVAFVSAGFLLW